MALDDEPWPSDGLELLVPDEPVEDQTGRVGILVESAEPATGDWGSRDNAVDEGYSRGRSRTGSSRFGAVRVATSSAQLAAALGELWRSSWPAARPRSSSRSRPVG